MHVLQHIITSELLRLTLLLYIHINIPVVTRNKQAGRVIRKCNAPYRLRMRKCRYYSEIFVKYMDSTILTTTS